MALIVFLTGAENGNNLINSTNVFFLILTQLGLYGSSNVFLFYLVQYIRIIEQSNLIRITF